MPEITRRQRLWTLLSSNFIISACTFGGGGVIIPVFQKKYVEDLKWISEDEMMDMIAIAQSSPGVMAINTAIMIGFYTAGIPGAIFSVLGSVLPPMIILSVISYLYEAFCASRLIALILKGMEAGVAAVMLNISVNMSANVIRRKNLFHTGLLAAAIVAAVGFGISSIVIILVCALISVAVVLAGQTGKKEGAA